MGAAKDMVVEDDAGSKKGNALDQEAVDRELAGYRAVAAQEGRCQEAIDGLLGLEKRGRVAEDVVSTRKACSVLLEILYEARDWKGLQEYVVLLSKRRSQLKQAVQVMVRQCMGYIADTPDQATRIELIKTLQALTEGKMYVEIERARLTRQLARMKEAEGDVQEAAEILQEVAVETFGAMAKTEKIAYILEQVRLCLDRKDFVRAQILSKKVSPRAFTVPEGAKKGENTGEIGIEGTAIEEPEEGTPSLEALKLQYYQLMIRFYQHERDHLEVCRCYRAVYDTPSIQEDPAKWQDVLKKVCWYVVLAPTDSHQVTLLETTAADKKLEELPAYAALLKKFSQKEVLWWKHVDTEYAAEVAAQEEVFGGDEGKQRQEDFRLRVIQHNLQVIAGYYSRISLTRLAQMLDLPADEAEKHLADMVTGAALPAKIDRPAGVVRFSGRKGPEEALDNWSRNIGKLLGLVEKTCQQIQKESMVHRVPIGAK
ncbi:26S proteasome non-ATPase regulatory subunit 12 [Micractinium conductrix]|uniref:26S proteasome non-ATPase regulatory subunit 12 n=1 Tax=Micractinium conductrix TaxID=554055 RepID=A0A2P6VMB7_9CHLO|nr:26S proteasome non-ATPase regulatory subunit 12 [Micractinium conductrix]|eukprot:PSC75238.1 26S proteasome non-ATPase regulatory subunit 12 [Micractinium conductrix]